MVCSWFGCRGGWTYSCDGYFNDSSTPLSTLETARVRILHTICSTLGVELGRCAALPDTRRILRTHRGAARWTHCASGIGFDSRYQFTGFNTVGLTGRRPRRAFNTGGKTGLSDIGTEGTYSGYRSCGGVNRTVGRWGRNCSTGSRSNGTGSRSNGSRSTGSNSVAGWRRCVAISITGHFHTFSTSLHAVEFANVGILPTISAAHWGILLRTEASLQTLWIGLSVEVVIVVLVVVVIVIIAVATVARVIIVLRGRGGSALRVGGVSVTTTCDSVDGSVCHSEPDTASYS
uniref:Uncharacterized protein n=1 Tax=Cacopsylla melanoneura TaxID=428564 RepID=A0A8D8ZMF7_9HEMI